MNGYVIPAAFAAGWFAPEADGRWTSGPASLPIDPDGRHTHIGLSLSNFHSQPTTCRLECGSVAVSFTMASRERRHVVVPCANGTPVLRLIVEPMPVNTAHDERLLGVYVHWFEYMSQAQGVAEMDAAETSGQSELTRTATFSGRTVVLCGDPADPYFAAASSHVADMADLIERIAELPDGACLLDVGANIGLSAIAMAVAKPNARIVAFEPNPVTFEYLRRNTAAFPNIEVVQVAVSDRQTTLHFHAAAYAAGSHVVGSGHIQADMATVEVQAQTLDELVAARGLEPSFIKIDVEGHEPEAIAGGARTIERWRPSIYLEFNSWTLNAFAGHSPAAFARALWSRFDVDHFADPLSFLHKNLTQDGSVSNIVMRLKPGAVVPSLDEMSSSQR